MKSAIAAALSILTITACTTAQSEDAARTLKQAIAPQGMEEIAEQYHYSPAVRAGDFLYLAGVVASLPMDENGRIADPTEANLEAAYEEAFQTIAYILDAAGADWSNVFELSTFHTDLPSQIATFAAVKDRYVPAPYPAWTAIDIDRLYPDSGVTEIKVIAYAPQE